MESGTKSKRPLGITILMIWFVLEGIYYFYTNSVGGLFGGPFRGQDILDMFGESFTENSLVAYGLGLALFNFVIAWGFMERKHWIRVPTIISFIITTGISGYLTFLGYVTVFEIIIISSLTVIVVLYLVKPSTRKYFAQRNGEFKKIETRFLIIIGICAVVIPAIIFSAIFMLESSDSRESLLDQSSITHESVLESKEGKKYEPQVLQCLSLLYHCDISSKYFEGCISAKKDGITIEELCSSDDIMIEDGCITVDFDDGSSVTNCE